MVSTTYRTGSWIGIVRSGAVIVVDARTAPETVSELWDYLAQPPSIHGVLNAVTGKFGTELTGMPPFAILVQTDRLHAILRGEITLVVHSGETQEVVSGREVSTWSERSLTLPDSLVLTLAQDSDAGPTDDADRAGLPLGEAVVRLQELARRLSEAPSADAPSSAATFADVPVANVPAAGPSVAAPALPGVLPAVVSGAWGAPAEQAEDAAVFNSPVFNAAASDAGQASEVQDGTPAAEPTTDGADEIDHGHAPDDAQGSGDAFASDDASSSGDASVSGDFGVADSQDETATGFEASAGLAVQGHDEAAGLAGADVLNGAVPEGPSLEKSADDGISEQHDVGWPWAHEAAANDAHDAAGHDDSEQGVDAELAAGDDADGAEDAHADGAGTAFDAVTDPEDAYAGFALAADAEWSAQLAHPSGEIPVQDLHAGESDLEETLYPGLGQDTASDNGGFLDDRDDANDVHGDAGTDAHEGPAGADSVPVSEDDAANPGDAASDGGVPATGEPEVDGFTSDYDHLFGATELRSVEDAAVRLDENGQELPKELPAPAVGNVPPPPPMPPATPFHDESAVEESQPAPEVTDAPAWVPPSGILIESVPWGSGRQDSAEPAEPAGDSDHDGQTVMRSELPGGEDAPAAEQLEPRPSTGPMVLARLCPSGHANPPTRSLCSDCGAPISSEPREVGRPRLGRVHISTGEVVELDHSLIIGRQPSVSRVMGAVMPRLVQVQSASGDISRSHVEVRLDGWDVMLVDLKATNGTVLVREGQAPRRLAQGEQAILLNGDIAELGDGVSLLFEGLL